MFVQFLNLCVNKGNVSSDRCILLIGLNMGYKNLDVTHPCRKVSVFSFSSVLFLAGLSNNYHFILFASAGKDMVAPMTAHHWHTQTGQTEHLTSNVLSHKTSPSPHLPLETITIPNPQYHLPRRLIPLHLRICRCQDLY